MTEPRPMKTERLAYLRGLGDDDLPAFWLVQIRDLLADRDWHRAQVRVAEQHVKRAGVTWAHVQAWAKATCLPRTEFETPEWAARDARDDRGRAMMRLILATIHWAHVHGKAPSELDVLEAMAAMEIDE